MKRAIIGLVALLAGCATANAMNTVGTENTTHIDYVGPTASLEQPQAAEPLFNSYVPRGTGLSDEFAPACQYSPRILVEPHSYTIECNGFTFIHYQHGGAHDVNGDMILEAGCENTLVSTIGFPFENATFKYTDEGCDGNLDLYETWHDEHGQNVMDARTTNPSASIQSTYDTLYNGIGAQEVESLWLEWFGVTSQSW